LYISEGVREPAGRNEWCQAIEEISSQKRKRVGNKISRDTIYGGGTGLKYCLNEHQCEKVRRLATGLHERLRPGTEKGDTFLLLKGSRKISIYEAVPFESRKKKMVVPTAHGARELVVFIEEDGAGEKKTQMVLWGSRRQTKKEGNAHRRIENG